VNDRSQVPLVLSLAVKGPARWPADMPVLAPVFVNEKVTTDQVYAVVIGGLTVLSVVRWTHVWFEVATAIVLPLESCMIQPAWQ
jgi:hypothetical protein